MVAPSVYSQRWSPGVETSSGAVLEYSAASHVGRVRAVNEDAFLAGPPVFVVADGMGGYSGGEAASSIVVSAFAPLVGSAAVGAPDVDAAIVRSRTEIAGLADGTDAPGSTVIVAAYVTESDCAYWLLAHAGDSRAYTWRAGVLEQVTRDHSLVQELVDAGEVAPGDAWMHPERHVVTRAIGASIDTNPEFTLLPVEEGSRLLLCTDGLTSELSSESIGVLMGQATSSQEAVDLLVGAAVEAGGHDNVTVLVVDVVTADDRPREDTLVPDSQTREDTLPNPRVDG